MTVERAAMVEFWPLVDIGRLALQDGDTVVLKVLDRTLLAGPGLERLVALLKQALPGTPLLIAEVGKLDFAVRRAMPEMRAEDLVQPARTRNME